MWLIEMATVTPAWCVLFFINYYFYESFPKTDFIWEKIWKHLKAGVLSLYSLV